MQYRIESGINSQFKKDYETYMIKKCGEDKLPNPFNAKHGIFHGYRPWEYDKVFRYTDYNENDIVLDTGAMNTFFCIFMAQFVKKIYAIDNFYWANRDYMIKEKLLSPKRWIAYVEKKARNIKGEEADVMHLKYQDNTFSKIICISTIEHVLDDVLGIKELARVLKKNGKMLLTTEFNFYFGKEYSEKDGSYYRIYNLKSLKKLIDASGLKLKDMIVENRNYLKLRKHVNTFISLEKRAS